MDIEALRQQVYRGLFGLARVSLSQHQAQIEEHQSSKDLVGKLKQEFEYDRAKIVELTQSACGKLRNG